MPLDFPGTPQLNDVYNYGDRSWKYNGRSWVASSQTIGYTGSQGITGFVGSQGTAGFVGSQGTLAVVRIGSNGAATSGDQTPPSDSVDQFNILGITGGISMLPPSGSPADGQRMLIRIKDNGLGARAITWTTAGSGSYRAIGVTLPATTTVGKITYVGCVYNSQDSVWDVVAVTIQA
jgi:hypothetical protein